MIFELRWSNSVGPKSPLCFSCPSPCLRVSSAAGGLAKRFPYRRATAGEGDSDAFGRGDGLGVVNAQALIDRGRQVFRSYRIGRRFDAASIGSSHHGSALDSAAGESHRKDSRMVIAAAV